MSKDSYLSRYNEMLAQPKSASQAKAAQDAQKRQEQGGYPYFLGVRQGAQNMADDFKARQANVTEAQRKYKETQVKKQLAESMGQPYASTSNDRNFFEGNLLSPVGQSIGFLGDTAFRALPFDEEIAQGMGYLGGKAKEAADNTTPAMMSMFTGAPMGMPASLVQQGDSYGEKIDTFVEESPRLVENLENIGNIATAGFAAKRMFRPEQFGRSLSGVSNWIKDFYNLDPTEGRKSFLTLSGKKLQDKKRNPQFNASLDNVFSELIEGETPEYALKKFFDKNLVDGEDGTLSQLGMTPEEITLNVTKAADKTKAGWLYQKLSEKYTEANGKSKEGSKRNKREIFANAKRIKGLVGFLGDLGVTTLQSFFDPRAIALYGKDGISPAAQRHINKALDAMERGESKAAEQAMGQFIYSGNHIPEQGGRVGEVNPVIKELRDAAFVGDANVPFNEKNFIAQVGKLKTDEITSTGEGATKRKVTTTQKDLKNAHDLIKQIWSNAGTPFGDNAKLVVKRPTGISGDHKGDLVRKHPALKTLRPLLLDIQKTGKPVTLKKVYEGLLAAQSKNSKGFKILNKDWEDVQKRGLWLSSGFAGGAVTEGGINGLFKVLPNGRVKGFMSDLHNFGEHFPIIKQYQQTTLPNNMVAVSMVDFDMLGTKYAMEGRAKRGLPEESRPQLTSDITNPNETETIANLKKYANTKANLADTALAAGERGLLTGAMIDSREEEE